MGACAPRLRPQRAPVAPPRISRRAGRPLGICQAAPPRCVTKGAHHPPAPPPRAGIDARGHGFGSFPRPQPLCGPRGPGPPAGTAGAPGGRGVRRGLPAPCAARANGANAPPGCLQQVKTMPNSLKSYRQSPPPLPLPPFPLSLSSLPPFFPPSNFRAHLKRSPPT